MKRFISSCIMAAAMVVSMGVASATDVKTDTAVVAGSSDTFDTRIWGSGSTVGGNNNAYRADADMKVYVDLTDSDKRNRAQLPSEQRASTAAVHNGACYHQTDYNDDGDLVIVGSSWRIDQPPTPVSVAITDAWQYGQVYCDTLIGKAAPGF